MLYAVYDSAGEYVVKSAMESREYEFYRCNQALKLPFVPPILHIEKDTAQGYVLVMKKFSSIAHADWDSARQNAAVDICARLNSLNPAIFPGLPRDCAAIDPRTAENAHCTWLEVVHRHPGKFDEHILQIICARLNEAKAALNAVPLCLCHGDFHPDNLVSDGERLYLIDWQSLHMGRGAGEISFFISRGSDFGIPMDEGALFDCYAQRVSAYTGQSVSVERLMRAHDASSLLTAFVHWPHYLLEASCERTAGVFERMIRAARRLFNGID